MDPRAPYDAPLIDRLIARAGNVDVPERELFTEAARRLVVLEQAYEPIQFLREQLDALGIADATGTLYDTDTGESLHSILIKHRDGYTRTLLPM